MLHDMPAQQTRSEDALSWACASDMTFDNSLTSFDLFCQLVKSFGCAPKNGPCHVGISKHYDHQDL